MLPVFFLFHSACLVSTRLPTELVRFDTLQWPARMLNYTKYYFENRRRNRTRPTQPKGVQNVPFCQWGQMGTGAGPGCFPVTASHGQQGGSWFLRSSRRARLPDRQYPQKSAFPLNPIESLPAAGGAFFWPSAEAFERQTGLARLAYRQANRRTQALLAH